MQIQKLNNYNQHELNQVIQLHHQVLKESTLNRFGLKFLKAAYHTALDDKNNICLLLTDKSKVAGFVVATKNAGNFYRQIINHNFLILLFEVLRSCLFDPKLLIDVGKWFIFRPTSLNFPAELQFIAVDTKFQGQGWGTKLIHELNNSFQSSDINQYKVGTWADNNQSNNFYRKLGFKFLYKENILGKKFNYYLSAKIF